MFSVWAKVDTGTNCRGIAREGQEGGAERWRNLRYEPGRVDGGREESGRAATGERRRSRVSAASPPGLSLTAAGRRGRRRSSAAPSRGTAPKSRRRSRGGGCVLPRDSVLWSCARAYGRKAAAGRLRFAGSGADETTIVGEQGLVGCSFGLVLSYAAAYLLSVICLFTQIGTWPFVFLLADHRCAHVLKKSRAKAIGADLLMFFSFLLSKWIILFNLHLSRLISLRTDCLFVLVCFHMWYWSMFLSAMMHTVKICFLGSCTKSSSYQYKIYFSITWFLSFIISFNFINYTCVIQYVLGLFNFNSWYTENGRWFHHG